MPEYLDPKVYDDKKVTLAGDIVGEQTKILDETQHRYPVVLVRELYLFRERDYPPYYGPHFYYQHGGFGTLHYRYPYRGRGYPYW